MALMHGLHHEGLLAFLTTLAAKGRRDGDAEKDVQAGDRACVVYCVEILRHRGPFPSRGNSMKKKSTEDMAQVL